MKTSSLSTGKTYNGKNLAKMPSSKKMPFTKEERFKLFVSAPSFIFSLAQPKALLKGTGAKSTCLDGLPTIY